MDDWDRAIAAYEHLLDVQSKYEHALTVLVRSKNIGSLAPLEILASEVERAHSAVLTDLRIIRMSVVAPGGDQRAAPDRPGVGAEERPGAT